jgi:hypothetical protein
MSGTKSNRDEPQPSRSYFEKSRFWLSASKTAETTVWETIRIGPCKLRKSGRADPRNHPHRKFGEIRHSNCRNERVKSGKEAVQIVGIGEVRSFEILILRGIINRSTF